MQYGCIGEKLGHSFSKEIHNALADYQYELRELSPQEVGTFLQAKEFRAINVTIPYKQTVIPYLDQISPVAQQIGAVNTIVHQNGRLEGYNTDFYGLKALLEKNGIVLSGKKVLILGSGGTSKTAVAVAKAMNAKTVLRASRTAKEDCITYEQVYALHTDAQIIINTTPVGMYPNVSASAVEMDRFEQLEAVADAIYNPLCSEFVLQGMRRGIKAVGGLYMLVMQAVKAIEFFLGEAPDAEKSLQVYNDLLRSKENIVLIGMPSCGKSTVAKILQDKLGRETVDTDTLIVEKAGMPIPEIFAKHSQEYFRDLESEVIRELSVRQGLIVATGGGAILREENVTALRRNGVLFFLDRPTEHLCATADRPLSSDRAALEKLYRERYDKYIAAAHRHVAVPEGAEQTAEIILKEW